MVAVAVLLAGGPAGAVSFGPLTLMPPSSASEAVLVGSIALNVASIPVVAPSEFNLTDVAVIQNPGGIGYTLDPTIASPALGIVYPDGTFLISTLFLIYNAVGPLAIPNVTGTLLFGPGGTSVIGLDSTFALETTNSDIVTVTVSARVPEPGTALLLTLGLGAIAIRARKETIR